MMNFFDAVKKLYTNPNIIIRRKEWDENCEVSLFRDDCDVKLMCRNKLTGDRRMLNSAEFDNHDWEIRAVGAM